MDPHTPPGDPGRMSDLAAHDPDGARVRCPAIGSSAQAADTAVAGWNATTSSGPS
jgi:hypothetical protein